MKIFKDEIERRMQERREEKSSTWHGIVLKILLLVFVLMVVRAVSSEYISGLWQFFFVR